MDRMGATRGRPSISPSTHTQYPNLPLPFFRRMFFNNPSTAKRLFLVVVLLGVLGIVTGFALAASGPAAPTITANPATSPTSSPTMTLTFSSSGNNTYKCGLDGAAL